MTKRTNEECVSDQDPPGTEIVAKKIFVTKRALELLTALVERTGRDAPSLVEEALESLTADEWI